MVKKVLVACLAGALLLTNGVTASAAGCGGWEVYSEDPSFCDDSDGCGLFWQKDTKKHHELRRRVCVRESNVIYFEYDDTYVKEGCC